MNYKKNIGFTFLELLFVIVITSIGLISIIVAINYGIKNVATARQRVIAINLAREGIEAVYNIRDTNRILWSAKKDQCRLKSNPKLIGSACENDSWMSSGNYVLTKSNMSGQDYFLLSGSSLSPLDLSLGISSNSVYALCEQNGLWSNCASNQVTNASYFRQIQVKGLFTKDSNTIGGDVLNCTKGTDLGCGGSEAKELRFCSKVAYIGDGKGFVELCSIITNFKS